MAKVYKHISNAERMGRIELTGENQSDYVLTAPAARAALGLAVEDVVTLDTLRDLLLVGGLTKRMNRTMGELIVAEELWDEAMELSRSSEQQVAFRASWALEWAYMMQPDRIEERAVEFLADLLASDCSSVQRVYSKMLCDMTRRGVVILSEDDALAVADHCFVLLTNAETPVAVKVWQIELLYDLMPRMEWIEENLTDIVRRMSESPDCTPAIAAQARRYFSRLRRQSK